MTLHDYKCENDSCAVNYFDALTEYDDVQKRSANQPCPSCDVICERVFLPKGQHRFIVPGAKDKLVVFMSPDGSKVRIPPFIDRPMSKAYKDRGYKRVEVDSIRGVEEVERLRAAEAGREQWSDTLHLDEHSRSVKREADIAEYQQLRDEARKRQRR